MMRASYMIKIAGLLTVSFLILATGGHKNDVGWAESSRPTASRQLVGLEDSAHPTAAGTKPILPDPHKDVTEKPVKNVVARSSGSTPAPTTSFANPKTQPGLVRWHTDFEAACYAAKKSGKPVLLFQMMGKLDDQFC